MFGKLASKLKYNPVKVTASSFISQIAQQKQENENFIEERKKVSENKYEDILDLGIKSLRLFTNSNWNDENSFKEAVNKFEEAQKLKPSYPEPYFYLSWLFLFIKETDLAAKYFNVANVLNPDLSGLDELRELIEDVIKDKNTPITSINKNEQVFKPQPLQNGEKPQTNTTTTEGEVFKPQPLQPSMRKASNSYSQYNRY